MRIRTAELTHHLYSRLLSNPRLDLVYEQKPYALDHLSAIASFSLENRDSGEVGDYLADHGIFVRTGRHCTGGGDSVRISLQCYNTFDEIDHVMDVLNTLSNDCI
jgi:selenocysteine lyase/cysteine desulfurase